MGWLHDVIKEIPAGTIAHERLALVEERYRQLEKENERLEEKNGRLESDNQKLKAELERLSVSEEFIKRNGVLWRKTPNGCEEFAYCPTCEKAMVQFPPDGHGDCWVCSSCKNDYPMSDPPPS